MSGDVMSFPDNWWEFVQQYQFVDKEEVYTNGSMLIPSFRVRQMVEHYFGGEVGKTSRYSDLFGTPEMAARTLEKGKTLCGWCDKQTCSTSGGECRIFDYDALLEWLRGDAE